MQRFIKWLGQERAWGLFAVIGITGTISLMLQAVDSAVSWVVPLQNGLFVAAVIGSVGIIVSRVDPIDRKPLLISIMPVLLGFGVGIFVPQLLLWLLGAGIGWLVVSQTILRRNVRREYQQAIRHLRKSEYDRAAAIISDLIKDEPSDTRHYRFRADLYRLQGKLQRAIQDYQHITRLEPESSVGYNGLSEIYLQEGELDRALDYARRAHELEPDQWTMPYNLGMIEDRLGMTAETLNHLQQTLDAGVPDSRHRLLIHLWLARAYARQGRPAETEGQIALLRKEKRGLAEWQTILESEQARTIRQMLAQDVDLARRIFEGAGADVLVPVGKPVEEQR